MLNLSYPSLIPPHNPYDTLLNSFLITVPPTLNLKSALPSSFLTRCGNCQIIQTESTVLCGMEFKCAMCGFPTNNLPEEHPVLKKNTNDMLIFTNKEKGVCQEVPSTVYIFALLDTSSSMISTYFDTKGKKYVSRLEVSISALKSGLEKLLASASSNRFQYKLCLITFGNEITIFGDLTKNEILKSTKSRKMKFEEIVEWVKGKVAIGGLIGENLKVSIQELNKRPIFNAEIGDLLNGETNLGGALGIALGIIEDLKIPLSHIVVLTDNYSNDGCLQLKYIEELRQSNHQFFEDNRKMVLMEVKNIRDKILKLRSSVDFVGFEEGIGVEFLSKMTGSFSKTYKAKVKDFQPPGSKAIEKIIDLNDFNTFVERSLRRFEDILGFQAQTSVFLNSIVKWIDRNPKGLKEYQITPGRDLEVVKDTLGNVWGGDQMSFSFRCVEKDARELQLIIHAEMDLDYLYNEGGKLELVPVVLVSEKILRGCDDFELEGKNIDFKTLRRAFETQRLVFDEYERENMLVLMHEFGPKELDGFWVELEAAGVAHFLKEKKVNNLYEKEANERRSLREKIKKTKEEQKQNKQNILKKIGLINGNQPLNVKPMKAMQYKMNPKDDPEDTIPLGVNKFLKIDLQKKLDFSDDN